MFSFESFDNELNSLRADMHASELHGRLIGYLCAVKEQSDVSKRQALYDDWTGESVTGDFKAALEAAYDHALNNLGEYSDFEFNLLLPQDERPINERVEAVALWCSGFLSGYGESGRSLPEDSEVAEAMSDLSKIAAMTDEVPEGEENEGDLIEIIEFVRISTLLIYADGAKGGAH